MAKIAAGPGLMRALLLALAVFPVAPSAQSNDPNATGAAAMPRPALPPVLPDLEWAVSGVVAVDWLGKHESTSEVSTADLRRARVGGAILWDRTWAASLGTELAHSGALGQASIAYFGLPVHFELGRFPEPFGLIQQESSSGQMMMELPACVVLAPGYGLGLAASLSDSRHSLAIGAFAPTSVGDRLQRRPPEHAITMRMTGLPLRTNNSLLHLGASLSLRKPRDEVTQFIALPETVLLETSTSSAPLDIERYRLWGFELGVLAGPLLMQAESILARIPSIEGARASFDGGYVEGGLTLGGLRRGYSTVRGVFGPTLSSRPLNGGGFGAFELAARYSYLDMKSDALGDLAASQGGAELRALYSGERSEVRALGLNWYPTDEVKLSFNRLDVVIESRASTERATVFQGRVQVQLRRP